MDKSLADTLLKEVEVAMKAIAEKHGVTVRNRGGRYDNFQFTPKFEFVGGNGQTAESKYEDEWKRYARIYGLKEEWLGKEVSTLNGRAYIIGLDMNRRKYPVVLKYKNGKITLTTVDSIIKLLGNK